MIDNFVIELYITHHLEAKKKSIDDVANETLKDELTEKGMVYIWQEGEKWLIIMTNGLWNTNEKHLMSGVVISMAVIYHSEFQQLSALPESMKSVI